MCVWFWSANSRREMMIYQTGGIWGPMDFLSLATSFGWFDGCHAMPCAAAKAQLIGLMISWHPSQCPITMAIATGKMLANHGSLMVFRYFPDPETPKSPYIPNFDG